MNDKPRSPFDLSPRASRIAQELANDAKKASKPSGDRSAAVLFPKRFHVYALARKKADQ